MGPFLLGVAVGLTVGFVVGWLSGFDNGWGWGWMGHADGDFSPGEQRRRLRREWGRWRP